MPQKSLLDYEKMGFVEWLRLIKKKPKSTEIIDYQFPSEKIKKEFLDKVNKWDEDTVKLILRLFLVPSGSFGLDNFYAECFIEQIKKNPREAKNVLKNSSYHRRLLRSLLSGGKYKVWEGITWIMELLPDFPKQALDTVDSYLLAHISNLPDGRIVGLSDAITVIRARYLNIIHPRSLLFSLDPYQFEYLIESLFYKMGYKTRLTKKTHDGGRDIMAKRKDPGVREKNLVQCKRVSGNIGVDIVRSLLGIVSDEKATKGTIVATAGFTSGAIKLAKGNSRIDLIDQTNLQKFFNKYFGSSWPIRMTEIIADAMKRNQTRKRV